MLTSAAIIAGMCVGSICLASMAAKAADKHRNEIDVMSYSWGMSPAGSTPTDPAIVSTNGGGNPPSGPIADPGFVGGVRVGSVDRNEPPAVAGVTTERKSKTRVKDIPFVKKVDKASPVLAAPAPGSSPYEGTHALYQDVVIPQNQPGASNAIAAAGNPTAPSHTGTVYDIATGNRGGTKSPTSKPGGSVPTGTVTFFINGATASAANGPQIVGTGPTVDPAFRGGVNVGDGFVTNNRDSSSSQRARYIWLGTGEADAPPVDAGFTAPSGPSASKFDAPAKLGSIAGETEGPRSGITDGTSNTIMLGERNVGPKAPTGSSLTSLNALGGGRGIDRLFESSRGGDQGISMVVPAVKAIREAAPSSGGGDPGCTVGCQNNLNTGKLPAMTFAAPGGGVANPTPQAIRILSNDGAGSANTVNITGVGPTAGTGAGGTTPVGGHIKVFDGTTGGLNKPAGGVAGQNAIRTR